MSTNELWSKLTAQPIQQITLLGRPYVTISHKQFSQVESHFKVSFNILNRWQNYRSKTWRRHVHAIKFPDYVQVQVDHFNPNTFVFLTIPHFIFDVVPYFCAYFLTRKDISTKL